MANVRWPARYRRRRCLQWLITARVLEAFEEPAPLVEGAVAAGDRLLVLPVLFHLMWAGVLTADLRGESLHDHSIVWKERDRLTRCDARRASRSGPGSASAGRSAR
ncbi:hypothetical protein ACFY78_38520 [Streptomyces olindensis]|uniref:hypothetical protein n=1 Tax=Streptomyces olindensis TaxID=358823 RepID=UPI003681BAA9